MNLFEALGLPQKWSVSQESLSEAFRAESRKFHPDRFYNRSPAEKRSAMARTTDITEAYRTLKDPILRASYLLRSFGKTVEEKTDVPDDPLLLSEIMEARETAQDLRSKGSAAIGQLTNLFNEFDSKVKALGEQISAGFSAIDQGHDPKKVIDNLHHVVIRLRYYSGTRDEIGRALESVRS